MADQATTDFDVARAQLVMQEFTSLLKFPRIF